MDSIFLSSGRKVDWGSETKALGVAAFGEKTVDTADGELKSRADTEQVKPNEGRYWLFILFGSCGSHFR